MMKLLQKIRHMRASLAWRKARKRGRTLRLRIGNVAAFFDGLNSTGIRYVVLRWFGEVPMETEREAEFCEDIDLLIDHLSLDEVVRLASIYSGKIKCDFYSPTGKRATGYKKMPYYPPVFADEILERRILYKGSFYVPAPEYHFKSLAYHLVYHKGLTSGIPSGVEEFPVTAPAKRPYRELLEELGDSVGGHSLVKPYTLIHLHEHLKSVGWSMPYDLMVRWPKEREWMEFLGRKEAVCYQENATRLPNLIVFLLRSDGTDSEEVQQATIQLIAESFKILRSIELDESGSCRVMRSVRGGNWMEHGGNELIPPTLALICNDESPMPFLDDDPRREKYPLISNAKVLYKNEIRDAINRRFPDPKNRRIVLHASDNAIEAQHHLEAVYGNTYPEICDCLAADVNTP